MTDRIISPKKSPLFPKYRFAPLGSFLLSLGSHHLPIGNIHKSSYFDVITRYILKKRSMIKSKLENKSIYTYQGMICTPTSFHNCSLTCGSYRKILKKRKIKREYVKYFCVRNTIWISSTSDRLLIVCLDPDVTLRKDKSFFLF